MNFKTVDKEEVRTLRTEFTSKINMVICCFRWTSLEMLHREEHLRYSDITRERDAKETNY